MDLIPEANLPYAVLTDYSLETCEATHLEKNCSEKIQSLKNRISWLRANNFKIVFGSDAVLDFTSDFKSRGEASLASLISLNSLGMSPIETLVSATATAGEMLDLPIGKIEKNFIGNFVAFKADPLVRIENVRQRTFVIFKGRIACSGESECQP